MTSLSSMLRHRPPWLSEALFSFWMERVRRAGKQLDSYVVPHSRRVLSAETHDKHLRPRRIPDQRAVNIRVRAEFLDELNLETQAARSAGGDHARGLGTETESDR